MGGEVKWYHRPVDEVFELLESDQEGITDQEAKNRLERDGYNEIETKKKHGPLYKFAKQFASPLIYILLVASLITFLLGEHIDSAVILGVVFANSIIGFIQERKAERALEALSEMMVPEATVIRDGDRKVISSRELVVGDLVLLEAGDRVPADLRLFYIKNFTCDESPLTGESVPVEKITDPVEKKDVSPGDQKNMAFAGTYIHQGIGRGIVTATGNHTEIGRISESIRESREIKTPLIKKMESFGILLSIAIIAVASFTFLAGIFRELDILETFLASVSLAVAAIPEGLPATLTITLAIGVKAMASRNAIIRSMPSVETLGSATVICSDKTGTLTKNQMTVTKIYTANERIYSVTGAGYSPEGDFNLEGEKVDPLKDPVLVETLKTGFLCNDASYKDETIDGDPTEGALLVSAKKAGKFHDHRLDVIPFESEMRYMATLHENEEGEKIAYVKGSPEKILEMSQFYFDGESVKDLKAEHLAKISEKADEMASMGLRVIGMAYLKMEDGTERIDPSQLEDLVFVGMQGMIDPPREEVKESIKKCKSAGIRVIMITGDHSLTASAIARKLGIDSEGSITGSDIDKMSDKDMLKAFENVSVFARTSPEHKLRIVKLLQSRGDVVAVTGDGINDAPALKNADIGIAMGLSGTEVAREASDMVLADDNFASIVAAVEEGRDVYSKIQKIIVWLLPTNGGQALIIVLAILLGLTLPLLPVQVLWVNMVTAVCLGIPIAMENGKEDFLMYHQDQLMSHF